MRKTIVILLIGIIVLMSGCAPFVMSIADLNNDNESKPPHLRYAKSIPEPVYETCDPIGQTYINEILVLTNEQRAEHNLPELSLNSALCKIAELRAADMADNGYFDHVSPIGETALSLLQEYQIFHFSSAENIGRGDVSCERMVEGWMGSESHRKTILSKSYHQLGIGIVEASGGNLYWVQVFTN